MFINAADSGVLSIRHVYATDLVVGILYCVMPFVDASRTRNVDSDAFDLRLKDSDTRRRVISSVQCSCRVRYLRDYFPRCEPGSRDNDGRV